MRYEIINPSDKCYIYSDDVRLAQIAGVLLGNGMYGLEDENGQTVLHIFESAGEATGLSQEKLKYFLDENKKALAKVLSSFVYADERTSLNNIGAKARKLAEALSK